MAKRRATKDLNQTNWDDVPSDEERGTAELAPKNIIEKRRIAVPKRRCQNISSKGLFAGFTGFAQKSQNEPVDRAEKSTNLPISKSSTKRIRLTENDTNEQFRSDLKDLNESVLEWCQKQLKENTHVDLSPVFNDYFEHMNSLDEQYAKIKLETLAKTDDSLNKSTLSPSPNKSIITSNMGVVSNDVSQNFYANSKSVPVFTFDKNAVEKVDNLKKNDENSLFNFGIKGDTAAPVFDFAKKNANPIVENDSTIGRYFGFNPFPIDNLHEDDDGPYEPPKSILFETEESDAFYSIKCKLFFLNDNSYVEKGFGILYLKPLDNDRTQLLIRAGTSIGTVLLNISLSSQMPIFRLGKNNVSLVCIPNPPLDPKSPLNVPTKLLIRVRNADEADQLLKKLENGKRD